jgi:hypothetical protein
MIGELLPMMAIAAEDMGPAVVGALPIWMFAKVAQPSGEYA